VLPSIECKHVITHFGMLDVPFLHSALTRVKFIFLSNHVIGVNYLGITLLQLSCPVKSEVLNLRCIEQRLMSWYCMFSFKFSGSIPF
jgi:hypothetical protein